MAIAQVQTGLGGGNFVCQAFVANPTQARAEGLTELLGDIVIVCTGGTYTPPGTPVPTANITITLGNANITSRVYGGGASEALLLIDEPNAPPGSDAGFPFYDCAASGGNGLLGATPGGCPETVGVATNSTGQTFYDGVTQTGAVPNVFHGIVTDANQVVFNGIPILAPVTTGYARAFRITNIRANVSHVPLSSGWVGIDVNMSNGLLLASPLLTAANVFLGYSSQLRKPDNSGTLASADVTHCAPSTGCPLATLRFTEGFASAFKERTFGAAQNIPGAIYGNYAHYSGAARERRMTIKSSAMR